MIYSYGSYSAICLIGNSTVKSPAAAGFKASAAPMTSQNPPTMHKSSTMHEIIFCTTLQILSQKGTSRAPHAHQSARSKATRGVHTMPRWCEDCFHAKQATRGRRWCVSCGKSRHAGARNVSQISSRSQLGTRFGVQICRQQPGLAWLLSSIDARQQSSTAYNLLLNRSAAGVSWFLAQPSCFCPHWHLSACPRA